MKRVLALFSICFALLIAAPTFAQDELVEMVIDLLKDEDRSMRSIGFDQIRTEAKGESATKTFAEQLPKLTAEAQAGLLSALADRGDTTAKPAIVKMLEADNESVRVAAIRAVSKLGTTEDCSLLVRCLGKSPAEKTAATTSLIQIQGAGITNAIADRMNGATSETQVALVEILASRRALDTIPTIAKVARGNDAAVRIAAMKALGSIGAPEHIPGMIQGVLKAARGSERANAERNVAHVCNRIEIADDRAVPILKEMGKLKTKEQTTLLPTLGRVGGAKALVKIEEALASRDGATHTAALAGLANWPNASVASKLIELAYKDPHIKHQRTALRALIRVAPMNDGRSNEEKLELLQKAMDMSVRVDDRRYAIQRAGAIRIPESLRWLLSFVGDPRYAEQACTAIVELAHIRDLRDDNKAEFHAAMDKVIAISKDATTLDRANRYKKGQTWVRPK